MFTGVPGAFDPCFPSQGACAASITGSVGVFWLMLLAMGRLPAPLGSSTRPRPGKTAGFSGGEHTAGGGDSAGGFPWSVSGVFCEFFGTPQELPMPRVPMPYRGRIFFFQKKNRGFSDGFSCFFLHGLRVKHIF